MKEGQKLYEIKGLEVVEYEFVRLSEAGNFIVRNSDGFIITIPIFKSERRLTISRIEAYTELESLLLTSLEKTRAIIRKHRKEFMSKDFKDFEKKVLLQDNLEIEKEITDANYEEIYKEDKLSDYER